MRLIDADTINLDGINLLSQEGIQRILDEQPTAYDEDKVVDRLEELREEILSDTAYDNEIVNHYLEYTDLIIEAVKLGGIE